MQSNLAGVSAKVSADADTGSCREDILVWNLMSKLRLCRRENVVVEAAELQVHTDRFPEGHSTVNVIYTIQSMTLHT
jgi:hypothetical protein